MKKRLFTPFWKIKTGFKSLPFGEIKRGFLISVFFFILFFANAQQSFNKVLFSNQNIYSVDIEKIDSNYYTAGGDLLTSSSPLGTRIYKLDINGNRLDSLRLVSATERFRMSPYGHLISRNDTLFACIEHADEDSTSIMLYALSPNLEIYFQKAVFTQSSTNSSGEYSQVNTMGFIATSDGGFLFNIERVLYNSCYFLKTDAMGRQEYYRPLGSNVYATSIVEIPNNEGYIWGGTNLITHKTILGRTNAELFVTYNYEYEYSGIVKDIINTNDNNFIAVGGHFYNLSCGQDWRHAWISKFDANLNIIKDTLIYDNFLNSRQCVDINKHSDFLNIHEKSDGTLIILEEYYGWRNIFYMMYKILEMDSNFNIDSTRITEIRPDMSCNCIPRTQIYDFNVLDDEIILCGQVQYGSCMAFDTIDINTIQSPFVAKLTSDYCDGYVSCDRNLKIEYLPYFNDTFPKVGESMINFKLTGGLFDIDYTIHAQIHTTSSEFTEVYDSVYTHIRQDSILHFDISYENHKNDSLFLEITFISSDSVSVPYRTYSTLPKVYFKYYDNSIEELNKKSFSIYPNPAKDAFMVEFKELPNNAEMRIYNYLGQLIKKIKIYNSKLLIKTEGFEKGIYIIKIGNETQKLIVE